METKNWLNYKTAFMNEEEQRLSIDYHKLCKYGIKVLDDPY